MGAEIKSVIFLAFLPVAVALQVNEVVTACRNCNTNCVSAITDIIVHASLMVPSQSLPVGEVFQIGSSALVSMGIVIARLMKSLLSQMSESSAS
jgi:hypothetical protein